MEKSPFVFGVLVVSTARSLPGEKMLSLPCATQGLRPYVFFRRQMG